ncbi:ATP-binding cassette domain-containing protein [Actinomycetospora straminea]|uniref:ATP-binding cassette domain-containing protein n=1 Tax=Actinomycetospora straminea TaxID=663607 RepID=A0ABP9ET10_9PSEU|nr:ABC transporter ATP-binding protein [Actinomycetospora straminea]MDD7933974.1 ABC transporter ATP-binding protein [Actinomycetospora straminea]
MILTEDLRRTFRRRGAAVEAVRGISLRVERGELVAVLGPNGAGKSTLLRMLTTLLRPTAGTARVAGVDVVADPAGVRQRIGYVGQGNAGGHHHRVLDELVTQGALYGRTRAEARRRAGELMEALELRGLERRTVASLSGGQRRRMDVAIGLVHRPGLLFLDEPTTGMDPQARANLWEHITRLRHETDTTVVLTTHYLDEADAVAERIVVVDHGEVIADAGSAALRARHAEDRIELEVDEPGTVAGLVDGTVAGSRVELRLADGARVLPGLLARLERAGVTVHAAHLHEASLDDVFLALTGRSLREEGAAA